MPIIKRKQFISQLPGPKGLPFLGNLLQLDLKKLHQILEEWADKYGEIYKFKIANKTVVAISNTELIQNILRDRPDTYRRISSMESVVREVGTHGVLTAEGEQWRRQRNVTMQAFKTECLRRFFPTMRIITERLHKRWSKLASSGQVVDVKHNWMLFMIDITTQFAFGYDINLLENENDSFQRHLERQLPVFNRRINAPFPYWHFFKFPSDHAMEKSLVIIKETISIFVLQARQRLEKQPELRDQPANFLEALLLTQDEEGKFFSYEEIQGNIMNILLAGEDTSAHTLSWLLYLITEHPDVQIKMQQEADAVLMEEPIPSDLTVIEKLNYIEAVIHETMRLKSVVPVSLMETNIDTELDGLVIPKGTPIMLISRYGALQEKNFTNSRHFKPERWLESNSTDCVHNRTASIPFGAGPRFCPARGLAMIEMKMAMAMVCKNFSVSRVDADNPVKEIYSFTMMPDKLMVKFEKR